MSYNWKDDHVKDGKLKDGWYHIRTWEDMAEEFGLSPCKRYINGTKYAFVDTMEDILPPTRCINIENGNWCGWTIEPYMVESPAFTIGKEYEFSDGGKAWITGEYTGYQYGGGHNSYHCVRWPHCREIPPKEPEIKLTIDGKEVILSEDTVKSIRGVIE